MGNGAQTGTRDLVAERVVMVRLVALGAAALALLFIAAAIVGHGRERAVYNSLLSTISTLLTSLSTAR